MLTYIPVVDFLTVFAAVLNCGCLYMFVLVTDVVSTVAIFSTVLEIGNMTVGAEEWNS